MVNKIIRNKNRALLVFLASIISITSFAFTYGSLKTFGDANTVSQGISGDTVYLNDFEKDYYYYTGQNYTYSSNMTTPSLDDKNIYNDSNLVEVTLNYNGTDKEGKYTGYVSLKTEELQKKFVYYKFYPVENGYINIELIDNPFTNHPNDLVFNGWVCDYNGSSISYDSVYYRRFLKVPVTYSNGKPNKIEINLYARWTKGKVAYVNSNNSFSNALSSLDTNTMHQITVDTNLYQNPDVAGYYRAETITTVSTVSGYWWNPDIETEYGTCTNCYEGNGTYHGENNPYSCAAPNVGMWPSSGEYTNDCTVYYLLDSNDTYSPNETYYRFNNNRMTLVNLSPTIIGTKEDDLFDSNMNMAGYFRRVSIRRGASIEGYYNNAGDVQSGTCTSNTCSLYELVQYYDSSSNPNLYDSNETYYYLGTRDTNIVVMNGNMSSSWGTTFTRPFTLTGIYNGRDYNPTWNVSNTSVIAYTDLRIENLTINSEYGNSNTAPSISNDGDGVFYANYNNVKIGRGIKRSGNNVNFNSVQGALNVTRSTTVGSSANPRRYKFEVESGFYNSATGTYGATTTTRNMPTLYAEAYLTYGNDYDRARGVNNELELYYSSAASWSGYLHSSNDTYNPVLTTTVKSGSFGTGKYDLTTGIYVGARYGGSHYAPREFIMEGGYIYNLIGAPSTDSSKASLNACTMYIKGGEVDLVTGGAGTSTTYGNRIIQITGGRVNYGVIGGSNGVDGESTDGTLTGDSYVYIGGSATIGNDSIIGSDNNNLFGVVSGNVFGAGNGNSTYETIGSVKNSNIVINDGATIKGDVYGSGNFGTVGYSATSTSQTNIKILGGTVNGSVFGSGNNSGSGKEGEVVSTVNIILDGGEVKNSIYGGSNSKGVVYGSSNINLLSGKSANVFGGGYGQNTFIERDVTVNAGENNSSLVITGDIYGGSAFGTVNSASLTTNKSNYKTTVNINNGTLNNVFGGGKGDSDHEPLVAGDITVNINGANTNNVYGGNNANGTPLGEVTVNVLGGTTNCIYGGNNAAGFVNNTIVNVSSGTAGVIYGGGKEADTVNTNVNVSGGTVSTIFGGGQSANVSTRSLVNINGGTITTGVYGGSNQDGTVKESYVYINSNVPLVYGGNNDGGETTTSNVFLNRGTIGTAYGGGNKASTVTSNITLNGGAVTSLFGGGNSAGVSTTNVSLNSGSVTSVYGGSNSAGEVLVSNVKSNSSNNLSVGSIYGGNNDGGKTKTANIDITGGVYDNIYGGGNNAETDYTNIKVNGVHINNNFFGGGNNAAVNFNTIIDFKSSSITGDLFGGGNLGEILGNTTVKITDSNIGGSAYAGGNGNTAVVHGNTNIKILGTSDITSHVFGGGNAANTGTESTNSSISHVNIAGGVIHGNVYGGANTAVLYGNSILNIGYNQDQKSDIKIYGTVFGGGEANASGSPKYDFSFIGVTKGIDVNIDGEGYSNFDILGSIFGSGNASSTSGYSKINISNYGTFNDYKENVSIQRTDELTIKNSSIKLEGATDRTNEFSTVEFSLSRIKKLVLANDSTLFLDTGANLLEEFYSAKIDGDNVTKATVNITDSGSYTRNVNNRVYMFNGKNLNIATNEYATAYGNVSGMTFFGMYKLDRNGKIITALYDNKYTNGSDAPTDLYAFTLGSYVMGAHKSNHNISKDGFYSNYPDEENEGKIKVKYVIPSPEDGPYYRWSIGEQVKTYDISLAASKYSTLGTTELPLIFNNEANTTFQILGFNYDDIEDGFELVKSSDIPRINFDGTADTKMGLAFEPSNTGFVNSGSTQFLTNSSNPIYGTRSYTSENSESAPSLLFYLYHSKNISISREIGTVVISLQTVTPIDELNDRIGRVNINVTLSSALFSEDKYEGSMTSGEKHEMFASLPTNINTKSTLSAYYSLFMNSENSYYKSTYNHALVSNYMFPAKTKITMLDLIDNQKYYYVVDDDGNNEACRDFNTYGECAYKFSNFIKMGSTSLNNTFDESKNASKYYFNDSKTVNEEFIFIVNFEDTEIEGNKLGNTLFVELRDRENTLINLLGIQRSALTYNLYDNSDAKMDIEGEFSDSTIYKGDIANVDLTGNFTQPIVGSLPVVDTSHFNKKPGVKITIYDSNGSQLNNSSLLGLAYKVDDTYYYPRMDGSVRIALTDKVANIFKRIKIDTTNLNLASGSYVLKIESFTSPDGIYYGSLAQDSIELPFTMINSSYGLKVKLTDEEMIIDKTTGYTKNDNNILNFTLGYNSSFASPNIRVSLYRRLYDDVYSYDYEKVNLTDYVTNNLTSTGDGEYMFIDTPVDGMNKALYLKSLLVSGTYKFVFSLYDGDTFIGDVIQYVIIK